MKDMNDKLRERWQDRRKKSFNWTKILIMLAALIAILYVMSQLGNMDNIKWQNSSDNPAAVSDSTQPQNPQSVETNAQPMEDTAP